MGICATSSTLSDMTVQIYNESKHKWKDIDKRRTLFFNQFGMWWLGLGQYYLYGRIFPRFFNHNIRIFRNLRPIQLTTVQIFVILFMYIPFIYFPAFYASKQVFYDYNGLHYLNYSNVSKSSKRGIRMYYPHNYRNDMKRALGVWIPAHLLTFMVIPIHIRAVWVNSVSFVWTMILSAYNGPRD